MRLTSTGPSRCRNIAAYFNTSAPISSSPSLNANSRLRWLKTDVGLNLSPPTSYFSNPHLNLFKATAMGLLRISLGALPNNCWNFCFMPVTPDYCRDNWGSGNSGHLR